MSLQSSTAVVNDTIAKYTTLQRCRHCKRYFTELSNVGMHYCRYHPGKYDTETERWTCCGEKRPVLHFHGAHAGISSVMAHGRMGGRPLLPPRDKGCQRRDCCPEETSDLPSDAIDLNDIASLIPYMEPKFQDRPGFDSDSLCLFRQSYFPKNLWFIEKES